MKNLILKIQGKINFKRFAAVLTILLISTFLSAQQNVHPQSSEYEWPAEINVKIKLEKCQ